MRNSFHHFGRPLDIVLLAVLVFLCQGCLASTRTGPITGKEYRLSWAEISSPDYLDYKTERWPVYNANNKGAHNYCREVGLSQYMLSHPGLSEAHQKKVLSGKIWMGMNRDLVKIALGKPWSVSVQASAWSYTEIWGYGNYNEVMIHFEDDKVVYVSEMDF